MGAAAVLPACAFGSTEGLVTLASWAYGTYWPYFATISKTSRLLR
ncbi:hypothetical protein HMPREF3198_01059 [Winkia neuii]|nr:hypothetical protein HMPREF3198_01059 [Winkia neuii]